MALPGRRGPRIFSIYRIFYHKSRCMKRGKTPLTKKFPSTTPALPQTPKRSDFSMRRARLFRRRERLPRMPKICGVNRPPNMASSRKIRSGRKGVPDALPQKNRASAPESYAGNTKNERLVLPDPRRSPLFAYLYRTAAHRFSRTAPLLRQTRTALFSLPPLNSFNLSGLPGF